MNNEIATLSARGMIGLTLLMYRYDQEKGVVDFLFNRRVVDVLMDEDRAIHLSQGYLFLKLCTLSLWE